MGFSLCFFFGNASGCMDSRIAGCRAPGRAEKLKSSFRTMFLIFIMSLEIKQIGYIGRTCIMKFLTLQSRQCSSAKQQFGVFLELPEQFFTEGGR